MKRHPSLVPLSREHHKGLILASLLKTDTPDQKGLPADLPGKVHYVRKQFREVLDPHFKVEEERLFPFIEGKDEGIDKLITELKAEHQQIREKISNLEIQKGTKALDELGQLLENHVRKEERELFQQVQSTFPEEDLHQLELTEHEKMEG